MSRDFNKVAILGRHDDARIQAPMKALARHLTKSGLEVFAAADMSGELEATRIEESAVAETVWKFPPLEVNMIYT